MTAPGKCMRCRKRPHKPGSCYCPTCIEKGHAAGTKWCLKCREDKPLMDFDMESKRAVKMCAECRDRTERKS